MNPADLFNNLDRLETYGAGATIFRKNDPGHYMYIVMEGEVEIVADSRRLNTLTYGEIFGEMALIDDSPRMADAIAKTDCVLAVVDERQFLFQVHETPMFALHIMGIMAERLRK